MGLTVQKIASGEQSDEQAYKKYENKLQISFHGPVVMDRSGNGITIC